MIHTDTVLQFVSPAIGFGLVATRPIPRGTITWVGDDMDQLISMQRFESMPPLLKSNALKYSYLNGKADRVLCWDHGRFVNHSCAATCLSPGFDFEIAVRDIAEGEAVTDDYGTLNMEEPFTCLCGAPRCRGEILPDDPLRQAPAWDVLIAAAFPHIAQVPQPLWELVREKQAVEDVLNNRRQVPSILTHYLGRHDPRFAAAPKPLAVPVFAAIDAATAGTVRDPASE